MSDPKDLKVTEKVTKEDEGEPFSELLGSKLLVKDAAKAPKVEPWTCSSCTLANEASSSACEVCGTPRSGGAAQKPWICSRCTLDNPAQVKECQACGMGKASEGGDFYKEVKTATLKGKYVGLYFSAHWCPPCRGFTPSLAKFYTDFKKTDAGKNFELVFVSSDRDAGSFDEYFQEMPWLALPFDERSLKNKLSAKYRVQGIPSLIILDPKGKVVTSEGRTAVMTDPKGAKFPWAPKPFLETLEGKFVDSTGGTQTLAEIKTNTVIGIYFSAHWCGPCRQFTPKLIESYNQLKAEGKKFEILFASSDRSQAEYNEYFGTMPWLAFPWKDARIEELSGIFKVRGIPTLVLLDSNGKVISTNGRSLLDDGVSGFPWGPKALQPVSDSSVDLVNEQPVLIFFPSEGSEREAEVKNFEKVAEQFFTKFEAKSKAEESDDPHPVAFLYDNKHPLVTRVTQALGLKITRPGLILLDVPNQVKYHFEGELTGDFQAKTSGFVTDFLSGKLKAVGLKE